MNSKCRVPYSARMLLPPDAHGQFLPTPLEKDRSRGRGGSLKTTREGKTLLFQRVFAFMILTMDEK